MLLAAAAHGSWAAQPVRPEQRASIAGRVLDASSSAPIPGAVVIATWWVELSPSPAAIAFGLAVGGHGGSRQRVAYVSEAVTDVNGRFAIPAWSEAQQWRPGTLTLASPAIRFLAVGYSPASAVLSQWLSGVADDLTPGLRSPRQMALFRPGAKPKADPGFRTSGLAVPTLAEQALEEQRKFLALLEADVLAADSPEAAPTSAARERVRAAQTNARKVALEELRRVQGIKEKP